MRLVPISEILNLENGETVPSVRGKIVAVYATRPVNGKHGPCTYQDIELMDPSGKIKASLSNWDDLGQEWKGREVVFSCVETKNGLAGLKTKDNEYQGKVTRSLAIAKNASMSEVGPTNPSNLPQDDSGGAKTPPPQAKTPPTRQSVSPPVAYPPQAAPQKVQNQPHPPQPGPPVGTTDVDKARWIIASSGNVWGIAAKAFAHQMKILHAKTDTAWIPLAFATDAAATQAAIATIMIAAGQRGAGPLMPPGDSAHGIGNAPAPEPEPEPPVDPDNYPEDPNF